MTEHNQLNWAKDDFENIAAAWEGDLWDRRRLGEQLTNYVDRLQCGAVLALDARWGEGKTWFVRHWKRHLETTQPHRHDVIYLDAFANDYLEDPFLTIASEISQAFKHSNEIEDGEIENFNSKTASVLISLASVVPIIATKAMLHWVGLGGAGDALQEVYKEGKDLYDTASEEIAAKVKEQIEKKIENHHVEKQTIQDFKKELAELAEKLDKPLVFIIDELDRCRPDFAIRLIERIKHFFDIPKIVFILVMDKTQFSQIIFHNYGYNKTDSEEYLTKFIDFTVKLNMPMQTNRLDFIRRKLNDLGVSYTGQRFGNIDYLLAFMMAHTKTSTRTLIKIINEISLLSLNDWQRNQILAIYLCLRNDLKSKENTLEVFEYIVKWFVAIVESDSDLKYLYECRIEDLNRRGRIYSLNQAYGIILQEQKEIAIQNIFIRIYDEYMKDTSFEYLLRQSSLMPFNEYSDQDTVDFKTEWESYISTGLSSQ